MKTRARGCGVLLGMALLLGVPGRVLAQPESLWDRYVAGATLLETEGLDRLDDALKIFDDVIAQKPDFQNVYLDAGEACILQYELRAKDQPAWLDRAEDYVKKLLEAQPDSAGAQVLLAKIAGDRGSMSKARYHIARALKYEPANIEARLIRLALLVRENKADEALAFAEETSRYAVSDPALLKQMGVMLLPLGKPDAVRKYLALAREGGLSDVGLLKVLAVTYSQEKRYAEAAHLFARVWEGDPDDVEALLQAGYCHAFAGAYDYAAWFTEAYLKEYPDDVEAARRLSDYRNKMGASEGGGVP